MSCEATSFSSAAAVQFAVVVVLSALQNVQIRLRGRNRLQIEQVDCIMFLALLYCENDFVSRIYVYWIGGDTEDIVRIINKDKDKIIWNDLTILPNISVQTMQSMHKAASSDVYMQIIFPKQHNNGVSNNAGSVDSQKKIATLKAIILSLSTTPNVTMHRKKVQSLGLIKSEQFTTRR